MGNSKCGMDCEVTCPRRIPWDFAFRISHSALRKPSTRKPSSLEPADNVGIPAHHAPHEIGAKVLDHRENRALIDAEVIDVEPAERRIHSPDVLLPGGGERGIEGVEEAVGREE